MVRVVGVVGEVLAIGLVVIPDFLISAIVGV